MGNHVIAALFGCLESYVSESAILEYVQNAGFKFSEIEEVEQELSKGNQDLEQKIAECGKHLAISAKNILRIVSPNGFLVITRFKKISKIFAHEIDETIQKDIPESKVHVYFDEYRSLDAGLGACDLIFDNYFLLS